MAIRGTGIPKNAGTPVDVDTHVITAIATQSKTSTGFGSDGPKTAGEATVAAAVGAA